MSAYDGFGAESKEILTRLDASTKLLWNGWLEKVDYKVPVQYHQPATCNADKVGCRCPSVEEKRSRNIKRPGLLEQLKEFKKHRDTDREPKAERGAPRVKVPGRPPGDVTGFMTLDEITCDAYMSLDRLFEEVGRDRTWLANPIEGIIRGLPYQVSQFVDDAPEVARDVVKLTEKWIRQAKSALRMTVSDAQFGDTVCGNCGGGLAIAWDNSSEVKCIGAPSFAPCGETYPMEDWVALYEGKKNLRGGVS